jgi:hypothetical protein
LIEKTKDDALTAEPHVLANDVGLDESSVSSRHPKVGLSPRRAERLKKVLERLAAPLPPPSTPSPTVKPKKSKRRNGQVSHDAPEADLPAKEPDACTRGKYENLTRGIYVTNSVYSRKGSMLYIIKPVNPDLPGNVPAQVDRDYVADKQVEFSGREQEHRGTRRNRRR